MNDFLKIQTLDPDISLSKKTEKLIDLKSNFKKTWR